MAEANGMKHTESDAPPTYAEAFPALPISRAAGAAAAPITRAIAPRASSAIRSTTVTDVSRRRGQQQPPSPSPLVPQTDPG